MYLCHFPNYTMHRTHTCGELRSTDIAKKVTKYIPVEIVVTESNDPRSYRVNSDRLLKAGFKPSKSVDDAVREIIEAYKAGSLKDEDHFYNLKWMQQNVLPV